MQQATNKYLVIAGPSLTSLRCPMVLDRGSIQIAHFLGDAAKPSGVFTISNRNSESCGS